MASAEQAATSKVDDDAEEKSKDQVFDEFYSEVIGVE